MNGSVSKRARHPGFRGSVAVSHSSSARTRVEMNALKYMLSRCWSFYRLASRANSEDVRVLRQKNKRNKKRYRKA